MAFRANFRVRLVFLAISILLFFTGLLKAQSNIEFKELSFPELSQNQVYDIVQDQKGFLWIATYNGVYKYDGYQISIPQATGINGQSLPVEPAGHLCMTRDEHLWIAYQNESVVDLSIKTGKYVSYQHKANDQEGLSSNVINCIAEDKAQNIWIGTNRGGLECFDRKLKRFIHYRRNNRGLTTDSISSICFDRNDNLYVGSDQLFEGLYYFDKKKTSFTKLYDNKTNDEYLFVGHMAIDRHDKVWCSNDSRLFTIDRISGKINHIVGYDRPVSYKAEPIGTGPVMISGDMVWLGSYSGLYLYNTTNKKIIHFEHNDANPSSINSNRILCLFKDRSENTWIGTEEGLMKVSKAQMQIHVTKHQLTEPGYSRKKLVRSLWVDPKDHTIWQGTSGEGLLKLNGDGSWSQFLFNTHSSEYGFNYVNDIYKLRNGSLALATRNGLQIFNPATNRFIINKFCVPSGYKNHFYFPIWNIWEDEKEVLWLGTKFSGLYLCDLSNNKIQKVDSTNGNMSIWYITGDHSNPSYVWLGTSKGLYYIDRTQFPFQFRHPPRKKEQSTLLEKDIFFIHQSKTGLLWLSTPNKGLIRYNPVTGESKQYTTAEGLPSNMISGILEDGSGQLWISSMNGIFIFNPKAERVVREYNVIDGLSSNRFNFKSCNLLPNGEMFFGSSDGINYFWPDSIKSNLYLPGLFITSFKTLYSEHVQDLSADSTITFPYNQNSFAIEYASDDYTNPGKNIFSYQLAGFSTDWSKPDIRHYTAFTNLDPGIYTIRIRGANSDGLWAKKELVLKVAILPPFWKTWWFRGLVIIFLLASFSYLFNNILQKRELKRKKIYAELAALRMQLNPHFVFNSLTSLEHFIAINQNKLAIEYLVKFSRLMRMILENSSEEFILLSQEIEFLNLYIYMESLRLKGRVIFTIIKDPRLAVKQTYIPPMLLQPIIENAIIHGVSSHKTEGRIVISFVPEKEGFIAGIEDNGVGFETAKRNKTVFGEAKKSVGLQIVKDRINIIRQMHGQYADITITQITEENQSGTRVEIKIPYIHEPKPGKNQVSYS